MDSYTLIGWLNDQAPAINQANLNKMDNGIFNLFQNSLRGIGIRVNTNNISDTLSDLNNAEGNRIYCINNSADLIANIPPVPADNKSATFWTIVDVKASGGNNWKVQFYVPDHPETNGFYMRNYLFGSWRSWFKIANGVTAVKSYEERVTSSNYSTVLPDLNSAPVNTIYNIFACANLITNVPSDLGSNTSATFFSFNGRSIDTNWTVQFYIPNGTTTVFYIRNKMDGSWKSWVKYPQETNLNDANIKILDDFVATSIDKIAIGKIDSNTKILAYGDSIMAGAGVTYPWLKYVKDKTGCSYVNKAIGGACFGESVHTSAYWISTQIANTSDTEFSNASLIIIAAGTNDAGRDTPYQELKEKVASAITSIRTKTNVPIIFITPIRRGASDRDANLLKLPMVSGIISNVALMNECSVIRGFDFPIPTYNNGQIVNCTQDGLHPNETGTKIYAQTFLSITQ